MKTLNITAEVEDIAFNINGEITCDVKITYKVRDAIRRKTAFFNFNVSDIIKEWEK